MHLMESRSLVTRFERRLPVWVAMCALVISLCGCAKFGAARSSSLDPIAMTSTAKLSATAIYEQSGEKDALKDQTAIEYRRTAFSHKNGTNAAWQQGDVELTGHFSGSGASGELSTPFNRAIPGLAQSSVLSSGSHEIMRWRTVPLDVADYWWLCDARVTGKPREHIFQLFENVSVQVVEDSMAHEEEGVNWSGHLTDKPRARVTLSAAGTCNLKARADQVSIDAFFDLEERVYQISRDPGLPNHLLITEENPALRKEGLPDNGDLGNDIATSERFRNTLMKEPVAREPVAIDMIVGYTPAAERRVGGQQAVEARIQQAETLINQAFASSNVPASVHIIGFYRASNYPYSRDEIASVLFGKLSNANDPQLGRQANQLREEYGVDLIGLLFDVSPGQSSGQGSLPGPNTQRWDREAFSVTDVQSVVDWYNFGHEVGHNLGLWHDRVTLKGQVSEEYIKANVNAPYGFGYITPNRRWHTLMAYSSSCGQPCMAVNQYSNTENTIDGQPLGDMGSNNAELARRTTPIVAGYRNLTKPILRYQLVLAESKGGFIRPDFFGPYRPGTLVAVNAYPDPGCRVTGWEVDGHSYPHTGNQLNVNVVGPGTVRARFACA